MNEQNWKGAFGPTPEAFKKNISFAIHKVKEEPPVKKIKAATILALSMIILLMAAVAYAAATQWGIFSFMEYRYDQKMPPEAQNALQTNLPQTGGEEADVTIKVREALYDGKQIHAIVEVRPKERDKVLLMAFDQLPTDLMLNAGPLYEKDTRTYAQAALDAGKRLISINLGLRTDGVFIQGSADHILEEDGTLVAHLSNPFSVQGDAVPLTCGYTITAWKDEKTASSDTIIRGQVAFDLPASTHQTNKQYSGPAAIEKAGVTVDQIVLTKTDAGVYAELTFSILPEATEAEKALARGGLWFEYLDEKGQHIELGTSSQGSIDGLMLADGTKSDTTFVQVESLDLMALPDSLTIRGYDCWKKTRLGQHTFIAENQ